MAKDAIGFALSALNRLAGSEFLDRLGMRQGAERLAYRLTKSGFQVITTSARAFKSKGNPDKPQRLHAPGETTDLFDLGITEEQRMIRDSVRGFAEEVLRERAEEADAAQRTGDDVQAQARELGLNFFAVPESWAAPPPNAPRSPACWWPRSWPAATWARRWRSSRPWAWPMP